MIATTHQRSTADNSAVRRLYRRVRLDRNSAAASLLVVLACGLVVMPGGDRGKAADGLPVAVAPAKSGVRLRLKNEEQAVAWIRSTMSRLLAEEKPAFPRRQLEQASLMLGPAAIEALLDDHAAWGMDGMEAIGGDEELGMGTTWKLIPIRDSLMERLGVLDFGRGLDHYPEDAGLLLRGLARQDGAAALQRWLAIRETWRNSEKKRPCYSDYFSVYLTGVPEMVFTEPGDDERRAVAGLMEGFAACRAEDAWLTISQTHPDLLSPRAVSGLIRGLAKGSDWAEWAGRIETLKFDQQVVGDINLHEDHFQALAKRWLEDDPEAAIRWRLAKQEAWDRERDESEAPWLLGNRGRFTMMEGTTGHGIGCEGSAFLLADWLQTRREEAMQWICAGNANKDLIDDLMQWTQLDNETETDLRDRMRANGIWPAAVDRK